MRSLISITFIALLLTACTHTQYHYQSESNPQKWQGQNIAAVEQQWGTADQVMHTRSGVSYYLYTAASGRDFFASTTTNFGLASNQAFPMNAQGGAKCTSIFKTDAKGTIISTSHAGDNCGGEWAPNKKS